MASNHKPTRCCSWIMSSILFFVLLLFEATCTVLDPSTKEWCKSQLERFPGLKDFRVDRRKMKEEEEEKV